MKITKIEPQKRRPNRFSVFIDGRFAFGMDGVDILYYNLEENAEISRERLDCLNREVVFEKAKDAALRYVGFQARSEKEVRDKLAEDYPDEVIERVAELLKSYSYLDDKAYARDFLERKVAGAHNGLAKVRWELRQRGVDDSVVDEAVSEMGLGGDDEAAAALSALEGRLRGAEFPEDRKERNRLYGYLARRGFSGGVIREVFERMGADGEDGEGYE